MTYTRRAWSIALLNKIGNTAPTDATIEWVRAWTGIETTFLPGASYNLLNTTEPNTPGVVSDFNSVGVKNYDSFDHGIQANAKVLGNGFYPSLYKHLKSNDISNIPDWNVVDAELQTWGTGSVYSTIVARMGMALVDNFPGNEPSPIDTWTPEEKAMYEAVHPGIDRTTGIALSWQAAYKAGIYWGPALVQEYRIGNLSFQSFAGGFCVWDHTRHLPTWTKYA